MIRFCNTIPDIKNNSYSEYTIFMDKVKYSVSRALHKGQMSNFGIIYNEFKDALLARLNVPVDRGLVITSSGHTALMAAYASLGVKRLLVPCYTFESTRVAATEMGIDVIVVDVDKSSGSFNLDVISEYDINSYDSIVVVAPLSSIPDLESISSFCSDNNKKLIVDGAASFGTSGIFNYGDMFCVSLHATKPFPMGEGGLVICDNKYVDSVERYITFGLTKNKVATIRGINGKVSEFSCAVGLGLLEIVDRHLEARKVNAGHLKSRLSEELDGRIRYLNSWKGGETVYQSLPVYVDKSHDLIGYLNARGIQTIKYYKPLLFDRNKFSSTFYLYENNVCLPVHSGLSSDDLDFMVDSIAGFYNG